MANLKSLGGSYLWTVVGGIPIQSRLPRHTVYQTSFLEVRVLVDRCVGRRFRPSRHSHARATGKPQVASSCTLGTVVDGISTDRAVPTAHGFETPQVARKVLLVDRVGGIPSVARVPTARGSVQCSQCSRKDTLTYVSGDSTFDVTILPP
ncbi:hypothetical protein AVEN_195212-1 [Araneus ventricosus]|uniref:Uncharacterized protein n=1 Tax=Araneus ventricosus TaxID=182803 RepID=A0A4Y2Q4K5_ARAVE|nr:hypothetical protein AVEN_195212-1 [Araneus ventricosus]